MSNTELKIVVDAGKPLKEVSAVLRLIEVANAAKRYIAQSSHANRDVLEGKLDSLSEAGGLEPFDRLPAIVGEETQVGQFVTASPAYGVYAGEQDFEPETVGDHYPAVRLGSMTREELIEWAVGRWHAEVKERSITSGVGAALDDAWREVIAHVGGDPDQLIGPIPFERRDFQPETVTLPAPNAWVRFLAARRDVIFEFAKHPKTYAEIARRINVDEIQVGLIHSHPLNVKEQAEADLIDAHTVGLKKLGIGVPEKIDVERSFFRQILGNYIAMNQPLDENVTVNDMVAHIIDQISCNDGKRYRTLVRVLEIDAKVEREGYTPTDNEQTARHRLLSAGFSTKDDANAAVDSIIAERLLGDL